MRDVKDILTDISNLADAITADEDGANAREILNLCAEASAALDGSDYKMPVEKVCGNCKHYDRTHRWCPRADSMMGEKYPKFLLIREYGPCREWEERTKRG